eukprot:SAG11_NODE_5287_length_1605_cov_7.204515_2_plen_54_part_00
MFNAWKLAKQHKMQRGYIDKLKEYMERCVASQPCAFATCLDVSIRALLELNVS